jgi:ribosomal protein S8E
MAIIQISKIQQRSGNIVDLPQLDEAEFGFASDVKKLYIGKESPTENIEVLTSYSNISFSQIQGAYGNLNIDSANAANGQVLTFTGTEWTNRGGNIGGLITLGNVANVKITGGQQNYSLTTDGTGNLSWAPTSSIIATIQNVTKTNPAVVTTTDNNYFTSGAQITITNVTGMTQLNGNTYYAKILTSNTFSLYSDSGLTTTLNTSSFSTFPNTSVSATSGTNQRITVGSSTAFSINNPIKFIGTTFGGIVANTTYYILTKPTGTTITISETLGGSPLAITTATGSCTVYATEGRVISLAEGTGAAAVAAGAVRQRP